MNRILPIALIGLPLCLLWSGDADGRGFGGFGGYRGGSFGGFGGYRSEGFGGYSGIRTTGAYSGLRGGVGGYNTFDRSYSGWRGGSVNVEGTRAAAVGPRGGAAAGGMREVTATGPAGRTYSGYRAGGIAAGPYGRIVGGGTKAGVATSPYGRIAAGTHTGVRFPTDIGLAHYSSFNVGHIGHVTPYWSHGVITTRAGYVRTGFGYYNTFRPGWWTRHPGCWYPPGWIGPYAWRWATWVLLSELWALSVQPIYYDYGNNVVYQDNAVYVDGQNVGTAPEYAKQATVLADQGQQAKAALDAEWTPLGVFALVQGDEKTSNNLFQLAVDKQGTLRGNYYDGLMDTTTPIYGSVDKKTQRAAWTIGKKNDRVFETGIYNLTKSETPCLVHFGPDRTQQWLLVRVEQPKDDK
jgi:hypothetical protein